MKKFSGENLEEYSVMIDESHIFQILNSINNQNKNFFFFLSRPYQRANYNIIWISFILIFIIYYEHKGNMLLLIE